MLASGHSESGARWDFLVFVCWSVSRLSLGARSPTVDESLFAIADDSKPGSDTARERFAALALE